MSTLKVWRVPIASQRTQHHLARLLHFRFKSVVILWSTKYVKDLKKTFHVFAMRKACSLVCGSVVFQV
jgi:hypothetical protein